MTQTKEGPEPASEETKKRKYEHVYDKIISDPKKPVKIRVKKKELLARVRKAVWKEKELCTRKSSNGTLLKKLYRLTAETSEEELTITFKLEPTLHPENF